MTLAGRETARSVIGSPLRSLKIVISPVCFRPSYTADRLFFFGVFAGRGAAFLFFGVGVAAGGDVGGVVVGGTVGAVAGGAVSEEMMRIATVRSKMRAI